MKCKICNGNLKTQYSRDYVVDKETWVKNEDELRCTKCKKTYTINLN